MSKAPQRRESANRYAITLLVFAGIGFAIRSEVGLKAKSSGSQADGSV